MEFEKLEEIAGKISLFILISMIFVFFSSLLIILTIGTLSQIIIK